MERIYPRLSRRNIENEVLRELEKIRSTTAPEPLQPPPVTPGFQQESSKNLAVVPGLQESSKNLPASPDWLQKASPDLQDWSKNVIPEAQDLLPNSSKDLPIAASSLPPLVKGYSASSCTSSSTYNSAITYSRDFGSFDVTICPADDGVQVVLVIVKGRVALNGKPVRFLKGGRVADWCGEADPLLQRYYDIAMNVRAGRRGRGEETTPRCDEDEERDGGRRVGTMTSPTQFKRFVKLVEVLEQGFPTWGVGTPEGSRGLEKGVAKANVRMVLVFFQYGKGKSS